MMLNRVGFVVHQELEVLPQSCLTASCSSASTVAWSYFVLSANLEFVFVVGKYSSYEFGCTNEREPFVFPSCQIQFLFRFKISKVLLRMWVNFFILLGAKISVLQHLFFSSDDIWNLFIRDYLTKFHVAWSQIVLQRWGNEFISNFFPVSLPEGQRCFSFSQGLIFYLYIRHSKFTGFTN